MGALEPAERRPSSELFLAPPSLPITAATKTETFRVQRIPLGYTSEHVKGLFRPHDRHSIQIKSLARNLQAVLNPNHGWQTATFTYTCPDGAPQLPELVDEDESDVSIDRDFSGLTPLSSPSEPATAHVVAITGLTGNAFDTFSSSATRNWLRDCLPKDHPSAQIWLYGYEAEIDPSRPGDSLSDKVDDLKGKLRQLFSSRHSWPRKIILIAHSLGCLITQKALVELAQSHPHIHAVVSAVFFGAPNNGLDDNAFATLVAPHDPYLLENELRPDSELIRSLQREFSVLASKMSILAFYETKDSPCVVKDPDGTWKLNVPHRIVKHKDASIHSHMPTPCRSSDHFTMPKLKPTEDVYGTVITFIQQNVQGESDHKEDFEWLALDKRVSTASTHSASGSVNGWSQGNSTALTTPQSPDMRRDLTTFQKSKFTIFPTNYVPYDGSSRPQTASAQSSAYSPRPHTSPRPDASPVILPSPAIPSLPQFQTVELAELDSEQPLPDPSQHPDHQAQTDLDCDKELIEPAQFFTSPRLPDLPELETDNPPAELPASPVIEQVELPARALSSRTPSIISDTGHRKLSFGRLRISRTKSGPRSPEAVDRAALAWFSALHENRLGEVKRLLGETKELVNAQDQDRHDRTALHYAIENRSTSVFELLMRRDGKPRLNINLTTTEGDTPLHYAARTSNHHYVQSLILKGAKWDAKNIAGDTPLHLAAQAGHTNVIGAFIELGAFTNIRDGMGRTPADVAVLMDHKEVVKRLQAGNVKAVVSYPGLF